MKGSSTVMVSRNQKISMLGNRLAINMARSQDPALFKKYQVARDKFLQLKQIIEKKYGRQGLTSARMHR